MKAQIKQSHHGGYQVSLSDKEGPKGTLFAQQIKVWPLSMEYPSHTEYLIELFDNRQYIGNVIVTGFLNMKPTEISDEEKQHMANMMQGMGMIEKDRHTLD